MNFKRVTFLIQYGLLQDRKQLLMIGACSSEQLPPWLPATHNVTPSREQKPFVTETQALRGLNSSCRISLYDVTRATVCNRLQRNTNLSFPKTIMYRNTQGTLHFNRKRDFTIHEIACLQGFSVSHEFESNRIAIKKQIGNAFPFCVVKNIYNYLRK